MSYASRVAAMEDAEDERRWRAEQAAKAPRATALLALILERAERRFDESALYLGDLVDRGVEVSEKNETFIREQLDEPGPVPGLKGAVMGSQKVVDVEPVASTQGQAEVALIRREEQTGVMALALMPDKDFDARLVAMKKGQDRVRLIQKELMEQDEDYGVIPGTKKPTLLKPGAEKLCNVYGLVPTFEETWIAGDGVTTPQLRCQVKCRLHRGTAEGPVVGEGLGAANSWERKHRYRGAERACPSCGCEGTIRRSSFERDGDRGWYCHGKAGGCGATFHSTDASITDQQRGQVENKDPYDVENTLLKMAKKRAHVDAALTATATSGLFSQDLEDLGDAGAVDGGRPESAASTPATSRASAPPATSSAAPPRFAAAQVNGAGKWHGPCPRCGATGTVIKSRYNAGWICWKGAKPKPGCGYEWSKEDAAVHEGAAEAREKAGEDTSQYFMDEREPGSDD